VTGVSAQRDSSLAARVAAPAVFCLFTAILCCLPHLLAYRDLGRDYTPFAVEKTVSALIYDETHAYAVGPSRFMRTGSLQTEPDVYELRFFHSAYPLFHTILLGAAGRLLGGLEASWILADALFPALLFLLLYQIFGWATSNRLVRILLALACVVVPFGPRNFLLYGQFAATQPLEITRTPSPELTFPFLLFSCFLMIRAIGKDSWDRILLAGVCLGINFYTYYFYTVAITLAWGVVCGLALMRRKLPWRPLILISVIGALIALPAVYNGYLAVREGAQKHLTDRMGSYTHEPSMLGLILLAASLGGAWYVFGKLSANSLGDRRQYFFLICLFLLALAASAGAGLNLQALTGFDPQHGHFYNRLLNPVAAILLGLVTARLLEGRRDRWLNVATIAGLIVIAALAIFRQSRIASLTEQVHRRSEPGVAALEWARDHTPTDAVLGTLDLHMTLMNPAISGRWNFVPIAIRSMASDDEIVKRYLIVAAMLGMSQSEVDLSLMEKKEPGPEGWRDDHALFASSSDFMRAPARTLWPALNWREELKTRKLDYLIAPLATNLCASSSICPEDIPYSNQLWKVIRIPKSGS